MHNDEESRQYATKEAYEVNSYKPYNAITESSFLSEKMGHTFTIPWR